MTRRIAIAILVTVWVILLGGGVAAYMVTRSVLLSDLDDTLLARAMSLPEVERPANTPRAGARDVRDRFLVKNEQGQTVARPTIVEGDGGAGTGGAAGAAPKLLSAEFARIGDGARVRTITVQAFAKRVDANQPLVPITIVYSGSADRFDELLRDLLVTLGTAGLLGGILTAAIAVAVAKAALKPMLKASELLSGVNETSLNQRVDTKVLPPELEPVGTKINEMLERLEGSFAQRKRFMADASHELRTPVAALVTTLEVTMRRERSAGEYGKVLKTCLDDAQLLRMLVEALMDQVRAERFGAGEGTVGAESGLDDLGPVNVSHLAGQCADLMNSLAGEKGVKLERAWEDSLVMITSESRVRAVMINLMSNAVEYTPAGGSVTVVLRAMERTGSGPVERLSLEVRDTGTGIGAEDLEHLFEAFYRADKVRGHERKHLGLGLYLVKTHVEALGGKIGVESEVGKGSVFRVELPAGRMEEGEGSGLEEAKSEKSVMRGRGMGGAGKD